MALKKRKKGGSKSKGRSMKVVSRKAKPSRGRALKGKTASRRRYAKR